MQITPISKDFPTTEAPIDPKVSRSKGVSRLNWTKATEKT